MKERVIDLTLIPTYRDLTSIAEGHSLESMVALSKYGITTDINNEGGEEMKQFTGQEIFVRKTVAEKLVGVDWNLGKQGYKIVVCYGYRHSSIQMKNFMDMLEKVSEETKSLETRDVLYECIHQFVAVPSVAGHPTGGAVDVYLKDLQGNIVDMGTVVDDYDQPEKITTFSKQITAEQLANRMILRNAMLASGFVPFNGEWWHFSFGDKEWAWMVGETTSRYQQINFSFVNAIHE